MRDEPSIDASNVLRVHPINDIEFPRILPNAPQRYPKSPLENRVFNEDIGRIGLCRNGIISILHVPPTKRNIVRRQRIRSVRILIGFLSR